MPRGVEMLHSQAWQTDLECGGKRYSARRRFLSMTAAAGRRAKAVPRPAHSAALVTALQIPQTDASKTMTFHHGRGSCGVETSHLNASLIISLSAQQVIERLFLPPLIFCKARNKPRPFTVQGSTHAPGTQNEKRMRLSIRKALTSTATLQWGRNLLALLRQPLD